MSGISSQHDATTLLQREVCLLIMEHLHKNDCKCRTCYIHLTWGIIWEPWQILSFVHWPCGVNYVCCETTRRAPWVRRTLVLACWSMAGMLISHAVLQTPNCNWSPFAVPLIVNPCSITKLHTIHVVLYKTKTSFINGLRIEFQYHTVAGHSPAQSVELYCVVNGALKVHFCSFFSVTFDALKCFTL